MDNDVRRTAAGRSHGWKRWARPSLLLLALPLAVALAACGSSGYGSGSDSGSSKTTKPAKVATPDRTPAAPTTLAVGTLADGRRVVTDADGRTLYRFDKDTAGTSACNGSCAATWPRLSPPADGSVTAASGITGMPRTITRSDGTQQVTLNGTPLYHFSGDQAAGDANGDGISGVWHVWQVGGSSAAGTPTGMGGY